VFYSFPFLSIVLLSLGVPLISVFAIKGISELIGKNVPKKTSLVHSHIEKKRLFLMLFWIVLISFLIRFYVSYIRFYPRTGTWDTGYYFKLMPQILGKWEQGEIPMDVFYIVYSFLLSNGLDLLIMPRVVIPLIYSLSVIPFYLLTNEITHNEKTGVLGSFLFAMCAESIRLIGDLYRNVFGIYFLIWSLFFTIKGINSPRKFLFGFLTFFYLVLTSITHQVCVLVYFFAMITYAFVAVFVQKKRVIGLQWLTYIIPYVVATLIYSWYFPGFLQWISRQQFLPGVLSLAQLGNNWFFSVTTNVLALIGVYVSIKKRNLQFVFATSFLVSLYVIWLMSGPVFGLWYFGVRIPERFFLFAFIPASILGGIALTHLIFTRRTAKGWKYRFALLILLLSMSGYDVISVVYLDYFYPPPLTAREYEVASLIRDNTASEVPIVTNLGGSSLFWVIYYIMPSRQVYQMAKDLNFDHYSSILETYYLFMSNDKPFIAKRSILNNLSGLNRIYYDGQVTIYACL
jgi:hypothetical protein